MKNQFSKAKVTIKEITKEEYEEANGINVLIDGYTSQVEEKRYLEFKLYLYSIETEQYELVTLFDFNYIEGTHQVFHSSANLKINNHEFQDIKDILNSVGTLTLGAYGPRSITVFDIYINQFSNF